MPHPLSDPAGLAHQMSWKLAAAAEFVVPPQKQVGTGDENTWRTMVFVRTKRGADKLVSQLKREGVPAAAIHGDLRQSAREKALKDFQHDEHGVLVATAVAARGSPVDDVAVVVPYAPPERAQA